MKRLDSLAYLTTDPLNAVTAETLAARHEIDLEIVEPRDLPRLAREQIALVIDWDFLPEGYRDELLTGSGANVVAIHGYNLADGLASSLPRHGILCGPRLDAKFFQVLANGGASRVIPAPTASDPAPPAVAPVADTD
jgi:hypothetical protein